MSSIIDNRGCQIYNSVPVPVLQDVSQGTGPQDAAPAVHGSQIHSPASIVAQYLLSEVPEFQRLSELRQKGWENPAGDRFFEQQRQAADNTDRKTAKHFFRMMKDIGYDMHQLTGVFRINSPHRDEQCILDMCMAPGGFLATALRVNPGARAIGFSLPKREGGHNVLLPKNPNVSLKFLDITLLAADMGRLDIPNDHPDAGKFLPRQLRPGRAFELVICDGQVLRNHERATYRERREASRLTLTQLALGLEHVKLGGTMIVLLHKVESPHTVQLLYTFASFASVQLFKHPRFHAKRSSFYMLATNIRSDCPEAAMAIQRWKRMWGIATFGTDEMYIQALHEYGRDVDVILRNFGPRLAMLGKHIWGIQADALARAPFLRCNASS
ncbi:hypothetical protein ABOM_011760 [Aspergillus bombycis]|uniref:Ribosomal RNA methyltransferase FtsJ domain-containing protein n=1 Tax=Aspergillus bombycis TaxID=109264 RepID=A0A1F7ZJF7_9EURO|nr:hypothetical protein ABOM_011760 [Aspergillus bombycis]OGM39587.1 hypothetical protein ABOM_011760 [Aspergillus bombycis]